MMKNFAFLEIYNSSFFFFLQLDFSHENEISREIWHASHCFTRNTCARPLTDLNYALFTEQNWSICSGDHCILSYQSTMISRRVLWILRGNSRMIRSCLLYFELCSFICRVQRYDKNSFQSINRV